MKPRIGGLILFLVVVLIGTFLMFGKIIAQGVAPIVSIFYNGNMVSSTNPLPVSASLSPGAVPTPIPYPTAASSNMAVALCDGTVGTTCNKITNASGANQSAAFAAYEQAFNYFWNGVSWTAVGAASPMPVTTPAPLASQSPFPWPAHINLKAGSGTTVYADTWPDTFAASTAIVSATTTQVVAGVANQTLYIWFAGVQSNGTNTTMTSQIESGTGATCAGSTVKPVPGASVSTSLTTGNMITFWGATTSTVANAPNAAIIPASVPWIVASGGTAVNVCIVTTGAAVSLQPMIYYSVHAN